MASALKKVALQLAPAGTRLSSGGAGTAGKHALAHAKMWERICLFGVLPGLVVASVITFQHEAAHHEPPPEYKEYEHMRIRKKNFPWGDGKKSFFHNPETNPLPGVGYEVEPKH
ncbi:cytochrome c oxidase subunit 6A2, mitochondrial [Frankliniella occidentalis]|uniref:Cytochrome c oxidase subunit n=1 Tax=Frankliniella occidentalis TaxID=133901 RepID=A0A6J1RUY0_FRAOC|nr:cytochrome c oxidase subunit 6A2, mitochondrial [Frankliniella occidentalis]